MKGMFILALSAVVGFIVTVIMAISGIKPVMAAAWPVTVVAVVSYFAVRSAMRGRTDGGLVMRAHWLLLLVAVPCAFWVFDHTTHYPLVAAWLAVIASGLNIALNYYVLIVVVMEELSAPVAEYGPISSLCGSCNSGCCESCLCHCHPHNLLG